jgi:outer membrane lipoprotein-sorting protein
MIARLTPVSLFAGTLACACLVSAASPASQEDILTRSRAVYASLKSYADTGTVTVEYGATSVSRHAFKTYYRAPRQFLFEFLEDKADGASRLAIWCDGGDFQSWWSDTGVHNIYPKGQGASAFVTFTGPTSGSAPLVASLVFANAGLVSTLGELGDMTPAGTEVIAGRPSHKLTGIARSTYGATGHEVNIRRTTIWIDSETLLVRKIFEDTPKGTPMGLRSRTTTTFEPQANSTIDDSRFRFVVPSLQK